MVVDSHTNKSYNFTKKLTQFKKIQIYDYNNY